MLILFVVLNREHILKYNASVASNVAFSQKLEHQFIVNIKNHIIKGHLQYVDNLFGNILACFIDGQVLGAYKVMIEFSGHLTCKIA